MRMRRYFPAFVEVDESARVVVDVSSKDDILSVEWIRIWTDGGSSIMCSDESLLAVNKDKTSWYVIANTNGTEDDLFELGFERWRYRDMNTQNK